VRQWFYSLHCKGGWPVPVARKVTFANLRHFLEALGFRTTRRKAHVLFEHLPSDTLITLKPYRSTEAVRPADLAVVQTMLDQRGLVAAAVFERELLAAVL
jgi:hypothetical protein